MHVKYKSQHRDERYSMPQTHHAWDCKDFIFRKFQYSVILGAAL